MRHAFLALLVSISVGALPTAGVGSQTYYPDYALYHDVDRYNSEVQQLAALYPACVSLEESGQSRNGDKLYLVKVTDRRSAARSDGSTKKRLLITFGEHAREFLPVESFFKLVHDSCKALESGDIETAHLLGNIELLLIGLVNPDGRRHLEKTKDWCWRGMANMVDVNRNCDWEWGGVGSSASPKNEEYRGTQPFSEPETRFVRDVAVKFAIDAYMSMHTGAQFIFVPYSDTRSKKEKRRHETTDSQLQLAGKMYSATAGFFTGLGIVYEMNDYTADGTIADYFAGVLKVPVSLTFELYGVPGDLPNCFEQFNPPADKIAETLTTFHPAYVAAMKWLVATPADLAAAMQEATSGHHWEVVEDADSDGADFHHLDLTKDHASRIQTLQQVCGELKQCNGFNSNGWLKTRVAPASQRRASKGTSLWIKKPILRFPAAAPTALASGTATPRTRPAADQGALEVSARNGVSRQATPSSELGGGGVTTNGREGHIAVAELSSAEKEIQRLRAQVEDIRKSLQALLP